jgi:hypothetical protein
VKPFACALVLAALGLGLVARAQPPAFGDERPRLPGREGEGSACGLADVDGDGALDVIRVTPEGLDVLVQDRAGKLRRPGAPVPLWLPPPAPGCRRSSSA